MTDTSKSKFQPALAKLEALLLPSPVVIAIDESSIPKESRNFIGGVNGGVKMWNLALGGTTFKVADNAKRPDIVLRFVPNVQGDGGGDVQGLIEVEHEFRWSAHSHAAKLSGTISIVAQSDGRFLTKDEISEVTGHELGHLLGLDDSESTKGLMGPFVAGVTRSAPSPEELDAVIGFREMLRSSMKSINDRL